MSYTQCANCDIAVYNEFIDKNGLCEGCRERYGRCNECNVLIMNNQYNKCEEHIVKEHGVECFGCRRRNYPNKLCDIKTCQLKKELSLLCLVCYESHMYEVHAMKKWKA